ncbi:hypothetical protein XH80_31990 [Bradyrhizobium sp. CCBAU 45384]|nr:hypothetical protein [Bradyrhizobium sp. CCBAU 45384]
MDYFKRFNFLFAAPVFDAGDLEGVGFARAGLLCGVAYRHGRCSDTVMVQRSLGAGTTAPPPVTAPGR